MESKRSRAQEQQEKYSAKLRGKFLTSLVFLPLIMWIWPEVVPFSFFEFWAPRGTLAEWTLSSWPIFAWGMAVNLIHGILTRNPRDVNRDAEIIFVAGAIESAKAGVWEETAFRWLFFFDAIVGAKIANFLFFGFAGFGITSWFHLHVAGPIANLATFGVLEPFIFHSSGWAVGAAMIATNAFFRDGHRYQGIFGIINSWYCGMFLFLIMFKYGLLVAIGVHFAYNFLIDLTCYVDAVIERARGFA